MRINLPVTRQEYFFPEDATLVSVTDMKGRITYCNPAFIRVSGFEKSELLGQAHNLIRHPDMPAEAYRDMWDTIQRGEAWSGLVKNRSKNGDHYWVRANVTTLMENGRPVGFMSVRSKPGREEVAQAEQLYRQMRQEAEQGALVHVLRGSEVVKNTWWVRVSRAARLGTFGQIVLGSVGIALLMIVGTAFALVGGNVLIEYAPPLLALAAMAVVLSLLMAWRLKVVVLLPMRGVLEFSNRLAAGDFSTGLAVHSPGLLGRIERALSQLQVNVRSIIKDVRTELEQACVVAQEIGEVNADLTSRTESHAASLTQSSSSM